MTHKIISTITALLVFLVALGSFALSYSALQDMAIRNGITGWLSYIWPLLIDFSLIVFSLAVVNAYLHSEKTWKQWSLVGIYTIATIGFNVAHAPNNLQAQIVAAIAPVSLFFSFEILMAQLKNTVKRSDIVKSVKELYDNMTKLEQGVSDKNIEYDKLISNKQTEIDRLTQQIDDKRTELKQLKDIDKSRSVIDLQQAKRDKIAERQEQVLSLYKEGLSENDIAYQLGVSLRTIQRDIVALNGNAK
jgi:hypothetical protein